MRHPLRVALLLASSIAVLVGGSTLAVYRASQQVPEFYRQAVHADTHRQEAASKEMLRAATALVNDAQKEGAWEAEFTEEQINGWLAVDLVENHGQALPPEVRDPRVAIHPDGAKIGWRWNGDDLSAVFSLNVLVGLTEPNQIALTIRGARAGTVPLPLNQVLDTVTNAARELNLHLVWKKSGGHPVALITVPAPESEDQKIVVVETIELRQGSVYLAGKTVPGEEWSATRDWSAFLDQIGEHPRQIESARRPAGDAQPDSSRKLQ